MWRKRGERARGGGWSEAELRAVWSRGRAIDGYDPTLWRRDALQNAMRFDEHGQGSTFGWEVDHIRPVAAGGTDEIANLQPLQWEANRDKGDTWPWVVR